MQCRFGDCRGETVGIKQEFRPYSGVGKNRGNGAVTQVCMCWEAVEIFPEFCCCQKNGLKFM